MQQIIFIVVLFVGAILLAFAMVATATSTVHIARRWDGGILQYFFYALFISNSLMTLLSGRDLTGVNSIIPDAGGSPLTAWSIRLTSLFLLLAALDQCVRLLRTKPHIEPPRATLAFGVVLLWLSNIVAPAFWSAHPTDFQHTWAYQPILLIGLLCLTAQNASMVIRHCRNATSIFCFISLVLAVVHPAWVIDTNYVKGILGGLPRLSGLATHPVTMGMIATSGVWCLLYAPFHSRKMMAFGLLSCFAALLLSQSKTTWIGFALGLPVLLFYRVRTRRSPVLAERKLSVMFAAGWAAALLLTLAMLVLLFLGVVDDRMDRFTHSALGAQMFSLTGRDIIWNIALDEWRNSPIFGYGPNLFDINYRLRIGMLFATDGHNQFYDSLARAGLVGLIGAIIYSAIIAWMGIRYSNASRGLSLILAISLMVRTISEVPFVLTVTNLNDTVHYLLICVIVSCFRTESAQKTQQRIRNKNQPSAWEPC